MTLNRRSASETPPEIDVHIDELIIDGVAADGYEQFDTVLRAELAETLAGADSRLSIDEGSDVPSFDRIIVVSGEQDSATDVARAVAATIGRQVQPYTSRLSASEVT